LAAYQLTGMDENSTGEFMDDKSSDYLQEIPVQLKKLICYLNVIVFCMAVITTALVCEVWRHW
jgi:hypothetical protein